MPRTTSSPRTRGPIRRALSVGCGVWVPAFAGTTQNVHVLLCKPLVRPQPPPIRIGEPLPQKLVPLVGRHAEDRDAFLQHPFQENVVGDAGDVASPIAFLRLVW